MYTLNSTHSTYSVSMPTDGAETCSSLLEPDAGATSGVTVLLESETCIQLETRNIHSGMLLHIIKKTGKKKT